MLISWKCGKCEKFIDRRCELLERQTLVDISVDGQIMLLTQ